MWHNQISQKSPANIQIHIVGGEELYFVQIIWFDMKESFVNYKGNEDPKVLDDPKISEEIMDFYDPKVFGDTFIFDGLVYSSSVFQIIKR